MKKFAPVALLFPILFASCAKDDVQRTYNSGSTDATLDNIYTTLAPKPTKASFGVASGGSVRAQGGTRFVFPSNAYQDASGKSITGVVDVEVNDWLKRGDMMFGKMLPVINGEALESGGQAYMSASQGGKPVFLKPGMRVRINVPQFGTPVAGMSLFIGTARQSAMSNVDWRMAPIDSSSQPLVYNGDTLSIFPDSFGYYNCDKFASMPGARPTFALKASVSTGRLPDQMWAYCLYREFRGIIGLGSLKSSGNTVESLPPVPLYMVVMGTVDGEFLAGIAELTPQQGKVFTVPLEKADPQAFKAKLNGL